MSWIGLRRKGEEILTPQEWNLVVDALDILYFYYAGGPVGGVDLSNIQQDIAPAEDNKYNVGRDDKAFKEVHAYYGYFKANVYVQGKKVIKDGDPIYISDFLENAETDIKTAIINALKQSIKTLLDVSNQSVDAGSYYESDVIDVREYSRITIMILVDYDMKMTIMHSVDGVNFYGVECYEDITLPANKFKILIVDGNMDYIKIRIDNPDTANAHNILHLKVKGKC